MGSLKHPMALVESFQVGDETRVGGAAHGIADFVYDELFGAVAAGACLGPR